MAYLSSKHRTEDSLLFADMIGGVNYSVPFDAIKDNELSGALNFWYDPNTFRLMNRPGVTRYSTTGESGGNPINGGFYSSILSLDFCASNSVLYKLDPTTKALTSIGALNGAERPHFLDFNSKTLIASGGVIQSSTGATIGNVSNAPSSKKIMGYKGRVVSAGDPAYPHRLSLSAPGDETDWDTVTGNGLWFDVALNVGDGITDFNVHGDDIIIYKGVEEKGIFRLVLPVVVSGTGFDAAYIKEDSQVNSSINFSSSIHQGNELYFLDNNGFKGLISTQKYGDIEQDEAGRKINSVITPIIRKTEAFLVDNPGHSQIWIKYANVSTIYAFHYILGSFMPFQFTGLEMYSAWYHEEDRFLLIGMDDGYVYKLDKNVFTDNGTAVPAHVYFKRVKALTNLKNLGSLFQKLLKQTVLDYEGIAIGTATLQAEIDSGQDTILLATISLSTGSELLFEALGYLNDATELLYGQNAVTKRINKLLNFYDIRFMFSVTSGAVKLNRIESRIALSGRR